MATDQKQKYVYVPPIEYARSQEPTAGSSRPRVPPPLPPRKPSTQVAVPPPYSLYDFERAELASETWVHDPRTSPMESISPSELREGQRTLLLIYIHGFMGNETSFQSLPAHVHNILTVALAESHVVHTKIYPRYKSRNSIEAARDNFSDWLGPHENANTDIVLLGHSMGGLLAAEVALMPSPDPSHGGQFKHRVLGTISFDTPFLGMHPGLVVSGIGSLFRPAPAPPGSAQNTRESSTVTDTSESGSISSMPTTAASITTVSSADTPLTLSTSNNSSIHTATTNDPYYNPPFVNDINIKERSGWNGLLHFANKHVDGLTSATKQYFLSHIEFGGCLADFSGLKNRYARLRHLEDVDDTTEAALASDARRIRFVNYYTASTGLPKRVKVQQVKAKDEDGNVVSVETATENLSLEESAKATRDIPAELASSGVLDGPGAAIILVAETGKAANTEAKVPTSETHISEDAPEQDDDDYEAQPMQHIDSMPIQSDDEDSQDDDFHDAPEDTHQATADVTTATPPTPDVPTRTSPIPDVPTATSPIPDITTSTGDPALPPIPPIPEEPSPLELSLYSDTDSRKLAEKEHKRILKIYQTAVKHRESALKDRRKLTEKREKKAAQGREKLRKTEQKREQQENEKRLKEEEKQRIADAKAAELRAVTVNPSGPAPGADARAGSTFEGTEAAPLKKKKDKRFCLLPGDLERSSGGLDKCWVRVYMEGVDEVGAHCGLFFPGPQYAALLGDTTERIQGWVNDDATRRAILDIHSLD
ncbi:hypothetical protein VC83_05302 [Pseudogymnoascus destructans]|uniref:DUF676 domain-containing protein n=2 Tax=Pseudogymnoascus destructans TaxID=655981 RepID=L8G0K7_PSED2|nr:uncharacterized protein VC83_05302 [Pseudogymnoascus destructans]ELR06642.1 hypothetical protein GMDG_00259 [Pseudogymnoascus destructans 20631-21]OAF58002.2 hypothetical protein VC83_05302 [Pseudogymnoascus destructans]